MKPKMRRPVRVLLLLALVLLAVFSIAMASEGEAEYVSNFYGTFWALVPPVVAIVLALISKEVYLSLFVGIFVGGLLYANWNPIQATIAVTNGFIGSVADSWNAGILMFLVILGVMVSLMNKAGGSAAYGKWAQEHIKSRSGAQMSTIGLGILIFVDDYFNCLTVGSVMRPVTDKFKVSRAKLSYLIDATAAPVCIIAPISSWAAAVTGSVVGENVDGFKVFLQAIPFNYYALMTILFMIMITALKFDYGPMRRAEKITMETGDLFSGGEDEYAGQVEETPNSRGKVIDLVLPVVVLILLCIIGMIYTGGFFDGADFITAFSDSDASVGLALGSLVALIFTFVYYMIRRVISFKEFASSLPSGFRQMVPAILILVFAWTLAGFCRTSLGADAFVGNIVGGSAAASGLLPAILYLIACGVAFATGTSWGTFAILIPIAQACFPGEMSTILILTISACMAGAVFGDHCSPISDTTIMASAGAQVNHVMHVSTQLPYAITVGLIAFVGYVVAGLVSSFTGSYAVVAIIGLVVAVIVTVGTILVAKVLTSKRKEAFADAPAEPPQE